MSAGKRWAVLGVVVVVAVVAFVIAQSSGGGGKKSNSKSTATATAPTTTTAAPTVKTIVVRNAKPVGGVQSITVKKGDRVRFTVVSDVADEIHVHGYDFKKEVPKGGSVSFDFPAKIDGGFDIELEKRGEQIASLKVQP